MLKFSFKDNCLTWLSFKYWIEINLLMKRQGHADHAYFFPFYFHVIYVYQADYGSLAAYV